ncbi:hypothetical protein [Massilia cavernae]|uniref:Lysozyme inhibitor n=1 Tax=Massilia cavernae TaxID=2320864 RepID=A0A418XG15_9BURK|nr:hypothetical protein [Massilia cavernae]RJG11400.1 hypothetical protein D3872_19960 [Massilia cavernae]
MSTLISKLIVACGFAFATAALCVPAAASDMAQQNKAKPAAKPKAKPAKKPLEKHPKAVDVLADEAEPDITDTTTVEYQCELNNKITIYKNDGDVGHIALRWKKRLHRLDRVGTTTGALRFENARAGLVWIGIPSKGMLLDSKLNRQLANECKNAEQIQQELIKAQEATKT